MRILGDVFELCELEPNLIEVEASSNTYFGCDWPRGVIVDDLNRSRIPIVVPRDKSIISM